jgi:hypothetical protein
MEKGESFSSGGGGVIIVLAAVVATLGCALACVGILLRGPVF